ncbi:hypothetical protein COLO4_07631 [Corchorus olitorius]|uniref:Uncharacterized protein n=1 Tax=Corchorus olitorius TaxID=93759 RepID=A0A1R3KJ21_9ROSI|nr:hypothetical protein COLO4_07631 [Corchorus olitorius]
MVADRNRNDKSLCEKSMMMVVNIIKLSSFSIAKMSLGATKNLEATGNSDMVTDEVARAGFCGSQRSEKILSRSKAISFVMQQPGGGNESLMLGEEKSNSDSDSNGMFAAYINKVHEKNRRNLHEASKLSPYILPPPPTPLSSRNNK